jgi:hypothetical protein
LRSSIESLSGSHAIKLQKHDRYGMAFKDSGSTLDFLVAGVRKSRGTAALGASRAYNYLHGTELSSWADIGGVRSLQASLSETHPNRLYIWESTARGYNVFYDMWEEAKADPFTKKAIFIGWWAKESYRIKRGTPRFEKFGKPAHNSTEDKMVEDVKELYDHEIDDEQLAWYRALTPAIEPGSEQDGEYVGDDTHFQDFPSTESDAFLMTGSNFFSGLQLSTAATEAKSQKFKGYRYYMGDDFNATMIEPVNAYRHAQLKVWEEPEPSGVYIIGADPAYGSSDTSDRYCVQVLRAYADGLDQVAEYCVRDCMTYQFAWVIAQLAGWYVSARLILEINGPGEAVMNAFRELEQMTANGMMLDDADHKGARNMFRHVRQYLYRRKDSLGGGFALQWKTTTDLKIKIMHQTRDIFSLGQLNLRSVELLEEMRTIVQEGSEIRASDNKKDDRVMALAMAVRAWHDSEKSALVSSGRTRAIEQARKDPRDEDLNVHFFTGIKDSFFAENRATARREQRVQRRGSRWQW